MSQGSFRPWVGPPPRAWEAPPVSVDVPHDGCSVSTDEDRHGACAPHQEVPADEGRDISSAERSAVPDTNEDTASFFFRTTVAPSACLLSRPVSLLARFGAPNSGRLLPVARLHSFDPTVEGRVDAFLGECCEASGRCGEHAGVNDSSVDAAGVPASAPIQKQHLLISINVGSVVGKYTGWKINLPVALETMLEEQVGLEVKFQDNLGPGVIQQSSPMRESSADHEQRQNALLHRLLQRLLQTKRTAYELLPAKRRYHVVDRLKGEGGASGGIQQLLEGEEDAEEGLGTGRVLRYRLASDTESDDETEKKFASRPAPNPFQKADETSQGSPDRSGSVPENEESAPNKQNTKATGQEVSTEHRKKATASKTRRADREEPRVEIIERVPLGSRLIYRPRSDVHIRISADSEIFSTWSPCGSSRQTAHGAKPNFSKLRSSYSTPASFQDAIGERGGGAEAARASDEVGGVAKEEQQMNSQTEVGQRWWAVQDVWELRPVNSCGRQGPRWRLIVTEEGEVEDTVTSAPQFLLKHSVRASFKGERGVSDASRAADDLDRYEETKTVRVHLEACGHELREQQKRRNCGQKNAYGALSLLVLENAHVLARWVDEVSRGDFGVGGGGGPFYFPNHMGDVVQAVQKHYNQRKLISAGRSRVGGLRIHNNQVKRILINKYVTVGQTVLELACGHGQDLWKYADRRIGKFVGVDLAVHEIREARRRVREGQQARHLLQQMLHPPAFHVGNLVDKKALSFLRSEQFDVVSIQLAIHYLVQTAQQAKDVLSRAAAHLKPGGVLLGSTVCCDALSNHLLELAYVLGDEEAGDEQPEEHTGPLGQSTTAGGTTKDQCDFGNEVYTVTFDVETIQKLLEDAPGIDSDWLASSRRKQEAAAGWTSHVDMRFVYRPGSGRGVHPSCVAARQLATTGSCFILLGRDSFVRPILGSCFRACSSSSFCVSDNQGRRTDRLE
ncbi:methyltransferase domain-containing protein [Cystoisospora suis]|uniref:mRNA (guanine-N(7))-methyltransferase n=1 Tax=Cystoisospora suis TaxID=483139 RepID=A0A2C6KWH5_9APIC|nr:methyltransferase domain-containing protein [Cystoisospora suis]